MPLTNGVEPIAGVLALLLPACPLDDVAPGLSQVEADKIPVVDLAQEADALAVGAVFGRQVEFGGEGAHLVLVQVPDGQAEPSELRRAQVGEEIGLVLDPIGRAPKPITARGLLNAGVVPRGDLLALARYPLIKGTELDALVAPDVRARGAPQAQLGQRILDDVRAVLALQRHDFEWNPELFAGGAGVGQIRFPRAVAERNQLIL